MQKNFDEWNISKQKLHASQKKRRVHERDVWWCSLWVNIGYEQDGKNDAFERPVLVIKKFNNDLVWAVPMSTKIKEDNQYYYRVSYKDKQYSVILSQMRLISTKRLQRYIRRFGSSEFRKVIWAIKDIFPV